MLLPVLRDDNDLDWASYEGPDSLAPGPRGLLQPTEPPRGVTAIASADLVIVPALAVGRGRPPARPGRAAATTGRSPGSGPPCPPSPCSTRMSCSTPCPPSRMTSGSGRLRNRCEESPGSASRCYHLAVDRSRVLSALIGRTRADVRVRLH